MSESRQLLLELLETSVHYGRAIVLASISLTVEKGELVAIIGPNGTGKTTLLRAISGLVELTRLWSQRLFQIHRIQDHSLKYDRGA